MYSILHPAKGYFQERRWIFESGCGFFESVCGILRESWKLGRHLHLQLSVCGHWERLWNVWYKKMTPEKLLFRMHEKDQGEHSTHAH